MLKVFYADINGIDENADYLLSDYRRGKLSKAKKETSRKEGIGAELLLNYAVKQCLPTFALPLNITVGRCGKPTLQNGELQFSLSHSEGLVAVALCDSAVGVDIQAKTQYNRALAKRFFAEDEQRYIDNHADKDKLFTEVWCLKESYIKALGTGLHTPLGSFSTVDMSCARVFDIGSHMLAVCVPDCEDVIPDEIKRIELT